MVFQFLNNVSCNIFVKNTMQKGTEDYNADDDTDNYFAIQELSGADTIFKYSENILNFSTDCSKKLSIDGQIVIS